MAVKSRKLIWVVQASVWALLMLLTFSAVSNLYEPVVAATHASLNIGLIMILFYSHLYLVNRFFEQQRIALFLFFSAIIFSLVCFFRILINLQLLVTPDFESSNEFVKPIWRIGALVFLTSGFVWLFAIAYQLLINRFKKERQNLALINQQQAAQLQYLKAQINPHFLFNALNNIYSLTVVKSDDAPKMLLTLSDLLRYAIYDGQRESVTLKKEVENIEKFIALFQMKSEHPLNISFKKQGNLDKMTVEPMIFIPLVENCFKHCDFETNEKAFIEMVLKEENGHLFFTTRNTFDDSDVQKDKVGGVGLENIKQRLALRYKEHFDIRFGKKDNVFEVRLTIM
jgi:two-component system, LytTR family, sensor kinase